MSANENRTTGRVRTVDAVIIGAGISGMYALHRLREMGLSLRVYDAAPEVGGTWWWNRYPGARVDSPGAPFYSYTFSDELVREWDWKETQPDQPSILAYLKHVADKFDLRRDIELGTRVNSAVYDEAARHWVLSSDSGERIHAQFVISAVGTLSSSYKPDFPGLDDFGGQVFHTGDWPQEQIDLTGKRVGIIGTGSSGVQAIPFLAREAGHLTVFQRTAQFVLPGRNRPLDPAMAAEVKADWPTFRERLLRTGRPFPVPVRRAVDATAEERQAAYEEAWRQGGLSIGRVFSDHLTDPVANRYISDFVREKIRETVDDPELAEKLLPRYYFGTKRLILGEGYYETYNRENVTLVDTREDPIERIDTEGIRTTHGEYELDVLVLATGYDALTGALTQLDPIGRSGISLARKWSNGARSLLGLEVSGFPNLFMIHGPQSPSVKFHMALGAQLQSNWIADCIAYMREHGYSSIEPIPEAEAAWSAEVLGIASRTLYPYTDSWFTGANIPGKPREFLIHLDGPKYHEHLREVARSGYPGFQFLPSKDGERARRVDVSGVRL